MLCTSKIPKDSRPSRLNYPEQRTFLGILSFFPLPSSLIPLSSCFQNFLPWGNALSGCKPFSRLSSSLLCVGKSRHWHFVWQTRRNADSQLFCRYYAKTKSYWGSSSVGIHWAAKRYTEMVQVILFPVLELSWTRPLLLEQSRRAVGIECANFRPAREKRWWGWIVPVCTLQIFSSFFGCENYFRGVLKPLALSTKVKIRRGKERRGEQRGREPKNRCRWP